MAEGSEETVPLLRPVLLTKEHDVSGFDCGEAALDDFLRKYALQSQAGGSARTYVATRGEFRVIGYYSLAPASIEPDEAPARVMKGQARHPVPAILMARYAVTKEEQGKGVGTSLFKDALLRALQGAEAIGGRVFLVHAKSEEIAARYERWGMERCPKNSLHLCFLFKDVRRTLGL